MGEQPSRASIVLFAVGSVAMILVGLLFWLAAGLGCEDADPEAFNTVRCAEDGAANGWVTFLVMLVCAAGLTLIIGTVWSLRARRYAGVVIGTLAVIGAFVAVFAINAKEIGPEQGASAVQLSAASSPSTPSRSPSGSAHGGSPSRRAPSSPSTSTPSSA
jgi:hypothetical protein